MYSEPIGKTMEDKKYTCRTEKISGISYHIKMYRDNVLRASTSFDSKERADRYIKRMSEKLPEYKFEVTEHPWTNNVCIECGREEY